MTETEERLAQLSPEKRALLRKALARRGAEGAGGPATRPRPEPIPRRGPGDPSPLSFGQQSLWFFDQWEPGTFVYNAALGFRVIGPLDVDVLAVAADAVVRRHEALRTVFRPAGPGGPDPEGQPVQVVLETWPNPVRTVELPAGGAGGVEGSGALVRREVQRPFDLAADLMMRILVVRHAPDDATVVLGFHHIAVDNWSGGLVCRDLSQAYAALAEGGEPALAEPALDPRDHAVWQRGCLQGAPLERLTEHWRRHLAGAPPLLALPLDRPRPAVQGFAGARHPIELDEDLLRGVGAAARSLGVTPYMYLLAVFGLLLYRWSGQTDVVVGTPAANRGRLELEGLVGLLTNTIVMRIGLDGNPTFAELVGRVRSVALANYDHDELPFERIVDAVRPPRDPSHHPVFQVNFRVAAPSAPLLVIPGLVVEPVPIDIGYSKFDLALELQLRADHLGGYVEYNEALFEPATIAVVVGGLEVLLRAVVADPHRPIATLPAVGPVAAPRRVGPGRARRSPEVTR